MKKILITNDDGIQSKSIQILKSVLSEIAECIVVAPHAQRSASSHAVSVSQSIQVSEYFSDEIFVGYQLTGTPVDCVKFALTELLPEYPDLIVSGINEGANTGISVFYSGTIAAAREGTIAGIPSIAASLCSFESDDFEFAASIVKEVVGQVLERGLPENVTLNINIPSGTRDEIKGIKVTKQADSRFVEKYLVHDVSSEKCSYSLTGHLELLDEARNNDEKAVRDGFVSITPIQLEMTSFSAIDKIKQFER